MNVRQLIGHLVTLDMDAEVMIEAPHECMQNVLRHGGGTLTIPVRALSTGTFVTGAEKPKADSPWVTIIGTDAWGLDHGVQK